MAGYINSIQQVSITLGAAVASNTATISAVGANAFLVYQGFTTDATADLLELDEFATCVLTNSTTVTVTRTTATTGTGIFNCVVVDPTSDLVTGVQAGTIAITAATSNTATITSVDTTLSVVLFLGAKTTTTAINTSIVGVTLTNATTVTANLDTSPGALSTTVSYVVITFAAGVINRIQQLTTTSSAASATDTATITAVVTANTWLADGNKKVATPASLVHNAYIELTDTTTVTWTKNGTGVQARTHYLAVVEFKSGVLTQMQRGTIALNSVASNTATITSVDTARSFCSFLGFQTPVTTTNQDTAYHRITQTNATTVTANRNTAGAVSDTVSYEVPEFSSTLIASLGYADAWGFPDDVKFYPKKNFNWIQQRSANDALLKSTNFNTVFEGAWGIPDHVFPYKKPNYHWTYKEPVNASLLKSTNFNTIFEGAWSDPDDVFPFRKPNYHWTYKEPVNASLLKSTNFNTIFRDAWAENHVYPYQRKNYIRIHQQSANEPLLKSTNFNTIFEAAWAVPDDVKYYARKNYWWTLLPEVMQQEPFSIGIIYSGSWIDMHELRYFPKKNYDFIYPAFFYSPNPATINIFYQDAWEILAHVRQRPRRDYWWTLLPEMYQPEPASIGIVFTEAWASQNMVASRAARNFGFLSAQPVISLGTDLGGVDDYIVRARRRGRR